MSSDQDAYLTGLRNRFWSYSADRFSPEQPVFEKLSRRGDRPPVFRMAEANILIDPQLNSSAADRIRAMIRREDRHRWFRSMRSSQALVQSIFGNLRAMNLCSALRSVTTEEGDCPFNGISTDGSSLIFEKKIETLKEPQPTSVDIWVEGRPKVAIECKLTEERAGGCSQPYGGHCDGSYRTSHSCPLRDAGVKFWDYVPELFHWTANRDYAECPLYSTYQLVRNVLAASINKDGHIVDGFAVLLFDERNPAFQPNGPAHQAFVEVKAALKESYRLQRLSWQAIMRELRMVPRLGWLTSELMAKYGI